MKILLTLIFTIFFHFLSAQQIDSEFGEDGFVFVNDLSNLNNIQTYEDRIYFNDFFGLVCYDTKGNRVQSYGDYGLIKNLFGTGKIIQETFILNGKHSFIGNLFSEENCCRLHLQQRSFITGEIERSIPLENSNNKELEQILNYYIESNNSMEIYGYNNENGAGFIHKIKNIENELEPDIESVCLETNHLNFRLLLKQPVDESQSIYFFSSEDIGCLEHIFYYAILDSDEDFKEFFVDVELQKISNTTGSSIMNAQVKNELVFINWGDNPVLDTYKNSSVLNLTNNNHNIYTCEGLTSNYKIKEIDISESGDIYIIGTINDNGPTGEGFLAKLNEVFEIDTDFGDQGIFSFSWPSSEYWKMILLEEDCYVVFRQVINQDIFNPVSIFPVLKINLSNLNTNGVEVDVLNDMKIFPNPARSQIHIETKRTIKAVLVIDLYGNVLGTYKNLRTVNISNLIPGIYIIKVIDSNNQTEEQIFFKSI